MEPVSPAVLFYLFADRFVPPSRRFNNLAVPCRDAKVDFRSLCYSLLAVMFWHLRDHGALSLTVEDEKGLLRTKRVVRVARRSDGSERRGADHGLAEELLLQYVPVQGTRVIQVVADLIGTRKPNPWNDPLSSVMLAAEKEGLGELELSAKSVVLGALGQTSKFEPACDKVSALEPAVESLMQRWTSFQADEPLLHAQLVSECRQGLSICHDPGG